MIQALNTFFIHALMILNIFSHTVFTSYILQTIIFLFVFLLWIYHMYSYTSDNQENVKDEYCILHPFLQCMNVNPTSEVMRATILTLSTSAVFFLGLEWISRTFEKLKQASSALPSYVASCLPRASCTVGCPF